MIYLHTLAIICMLLFMTLVSAQDLLFSTIKAQVAGDRAGSCGLGIEYFKSKSIADMPLQGTLVNVPVICSLGLGDFAETWVRVDAWRAIDESSVYRSGGGDPYFYTKLKLKDEGRVSPAFAIIYGVKEPASNMPLGSNEAVFYAITSFSKTYSATALHINMGVAILGDPKNNSAQLDTTLFRVLTTRRLTSDWELALEYDSRTWVSGVWYKFWKTASSEVNRRTLGLGLHYSLNKAHRLTLKLNKGLISPSETGAIQLGFQRDFGK